MKIIKYMNDTDDEDDNFVIVSCRASTKRACKTISESDMMTLMRGHGSDQRRVSPKWLLDAMRNMNPLQKKAVEYMGFGAIFSSPD